MFSVHLHKQFYFLDYQTDMYIIQFIENSEV